MLKGLAIGLEFAEGFPELNPKVFSCCHGSGERLSELRQAVLRCTVHERLGRVRGLMGLYERIWGRHGFRPPYSVGPDQEALMLSEVSDSLKGHGPQAHIHSGIVNTPSQLWARAILATWRFGAEPWFINLTKPHGASPYPPQRLLSSGRPLAVFVEGVTQLWEPKLANEFEGLVSFVYKSNSYLWVEFTSEPQLPNAAPVATDAKRAFQNKIAGLRRKPPLECLEAGCRSILANLSRLPRTLEGNNG
jgi:hypothetical protein